jgi:hypothetical protein
MQRKHRGHRQRQPAPTHTAAEREDLPCEEEYQQRGGEMNGQIRRVIGERVEPGKPVVEGKGEIG